VAMGYQALTNDTKGSISTAIGHHALQTQNFTNATNTYNTAVGYQAGKEVTTGTSNTIIGANAGDALTTGENNVAIGAFALSAEDAHGRNVAIGRNALLVQNVGNNGNNVAIGYNAGASVTTGKENVFVGSFTGDGTDDGQSNTALGYAALTSNCANSNTAVGNNALSSCTGGDNTAMGQNAGENITSGTNNLLLGHDAGITGSPGGNITTDTNFIGIGDENITQIRTAVSVTATSDSRDKTDFTALDIGLDFVNKLQPYTFKWDKRSKYGDKYADGYDLNAQTPDGTHKEDWLDIGFKAQDVEVLEVAEGYKKEDKTNLTVSLSTDGTQYGMKYEKFVPILVKALQELSAKNDALEARIKTLEG